MPGVLSFRDRYHRALDAYLSKDFVDAIKLLEAMAVSDAKDLSVAFLLQRCRQLAQRDSDCLDSEMFLFG